MTKSRGIKTEQSKTATEDYHTYVKAIKTAEKMKEFRQDFHLEGVQKLIIEGEDLRGKRTLERRNIIGKVISQNENIVTLQLEHYKESFSIASFFCGEICIGG